MSFKSLPINENYFKSEGCTLTVSDDYPDSSVGLTDDKYIDPSTAVEEGLTDKDYIDPSEALNDDLSAEEIAELEALMASAKAEEAMAESTEEQPKETKKSKKK